MHRLSNVVHYVIYRINDFIDKYRATSGTLPSENVVYNFCIELSTDIHWNNTLLTTSRFFAHIRCKPSYSHHTIIIYNKWYTAVPFVRSPHTLAKTDLEISFIFDLVLILEHVLDEA